MTILTDLQQQILALFFSLDDCRRHFYLTGGTALSAFHLEHRYSDDLDFFTHTVDLDSIDRVVEDGIRSAGHTITKERSSATFRRYTIDQSLQVDLVHEADFRVGAPELRGTFMVDNIKNIAVNKITALYGRLEPKDYVDLLAIQQHCHFDIMELLQLAREKDGGLEPFQWVKVIADVDTITVLPRMLTPLTLPQLKKFFHRVRDQVLDHLKPTL